MIRVPELPTVQSQAVNNPEARIGAANATNAALGGPIAQAIGGSGEAFQGVADQAQKLDNARAESEARQKLAADYSKLQIDLEKDLDPKSRIDKTQAFLMEQRGMPDRPEYPPQVRDSLRTHFSSFASEATIRAGKDAAMLTAKRAELSLSNEIETAKKTGNREVFDSAVATGEREGIILPEQSERLKKDFNRITAFNGVVKEIDTDPINALESLEDQEFLKQNPDLDPDSVQRLRNYAEPLANRSKAELWDNVLNASIDGKIITADELKSLADEGMISPEQRAQYLSTYHGPGKPVFDATIYEDAFSVISRYSPDQDPNGATLAQLRGQLATLPLPAESLKELSKRLTDRATPPKPEAKKRHRLEGDFQARTDQHFEEGKFGNWFKYDFPRDAAGNQIPGKEQTKVIQGSDWSKALTTKRRFLDQWEAYLQNSPEGIDPTEAEKVYQSIFEKVVLDSDEALPTGGAVPPAPPAVEFNDIDGLLGTPGEPPATSRLPAQSSTFGGIPILPPGRFYQDAKATVFGGRNDPADNGKSAFGGTTGAGGREGVAIPHDILKATFPGKDKAWFEKNVRVAVRTADGRKAVMPIADLGTAEWVWKKNGKPTLDLTPGAVKQLGGSVIYDDGGKMSGVKGIGNLSFALTTDNAGPEADLSRMTWEEASAAWFSDKKPRAPEQIASGLAALRHAWNSAQLTDLLDRNPDDNAPAALPLAKPGETEVTNLNTGDLSQYNVVR
jgi:hypothetical protein